MSAASETRHCVRRILVVDDQRTNRLIVNTLLTKCGFDVVEASNGEEAIEQYLRETPDIILMDVTMPGMDGYEATRRIRALAGEHWLPIIFISALSETQDLTTGLEAGGDDFLLKPFNHTVLLAKLNAFGRTLDMQHSVAEARRQAEAIAENIYEGIVVIDETGLIQSCNSRARSLFGYTGDEMLGSNVNMLMPEPYHSAHDGYLANFASGGQSRMAVLCEREVLGKRKNGEVFLMRLGVSQIEVQGKLNFLGVVRDISARKAAEQKILEQTVDLQRYQEEQEIERSLAGELMLRQIDRKGTQCPRVHRWMLPAGHFSGDAIACEQTPDGRLYALLADATGHGLAAAVTVLPMLTLFYRLAGQGAPLAEIVREINIELRTILPVGRFIGAALVCVEANAQSAEVWVGGMPDVLLLSDAGEILARIPSWNFALGTIDFSAADLQPQKLTTPPNSQFVLYSDGVVDMTDAAGEFLGEARLEAALCAHPPAQRLAVVQALVAECQGEQAAQDDVSLLLVDC
ncbi:MAG: SpoIIE family protein phosphatase [Pseudomonadota bacterium]|nr:SpoIIE family protein phosphatase [Pseudomonadota bacterium]